MVPSPFFRRKCGKSSALRLLVPPPQHIVLPPLIRPHLGTCHRVPLAISETKAKVVYPNPSSSSSCRRFLRIHSRYSSTARLITSSHTLYGENLSISSYPSHGNPSAVRNTVKYSAQRFSSTSPVPSTTHTAAYRNDRMPARFSSWLLINPTWSIRNPTNRPSGSIRITSATCSSTLPTSLFTRSSAPAPTAVKKIALLSLNNPTSRSPRSWPILASATFILD